MRTALVLPVLAAIAASVVLAASGCNGVLGIEQAVVDTTLAEGGVINVNTATFNCDSYCDVIAKNCTGANSEYVNRLACKEMCKHFETGRDGEQSGDSLACRVYHTNAAKLDPDVHCRHAGPTGGGHCGDDPCKAFCLLDFAICGSRNPLPYASEQACRQICPQYTYAASGMGVGDLTMQDGPTLNCRIYHLESAVNDPDTHCNHTTFSNVHCTPPSDASAAH